MFRCCLPVAHFTRFTKGSLHLLTLRVDYSNQKGQYINGVLENFVDNRVESCNIASFAVISVRVDNAIRFNGNGVNG